MRKKFIAILMMSFFIAGCSSKVDDKIVEDTTPAATELNKEIPTDEIEIDEGVTDGVPTDEGAKDEIPTDANSVETTSPEEEKVLTRITETDFFESDDEYYIYVGRNTCPLCVDFLPILKEVVEENNLNIYYFDSDLWRGSEEGTDFLDKYGVEFVPTMVHIKDRTLLEAFKVENGFNPKTLKNDLTDYLID